ncbi:MAG TPA: outer membrane beta-barrel protein [Methylomirabilota bacterium]|jgi:opacity protein-like surface antigen|nr:outer membrane beta-barrel protein [Methylomirabilota bacterium]
MRAVVLVLFSALAVAAVARPAAAEWFADAYLGAAITHQDDITFTTFNVERTQDANFRSSAVYGLRLGRWFDDLSWLGLAVDGSYFRATKDLQVFPLTALVMVRYGFLRDDEFKDGRLQPYAALGGGVFISNVDGTLGFLKASDTSVDIGLDTRVGVAYRFEGNWAAFLEYRFTHVSPSYDVKPFGGRTSADTTLNTSHFLLGLSYRF